MGGRGRRQGIGMSGGIWETLAWQRLEETTITATSYSSQPGHLNIARLGIISNNRSWRRRREVWHLNAILWRRVRRLSCLSRLQRYSPSCAMEN